MKRARETVILAAALTSALAAGVAAADAPAAGALSGAGFAPRVPVSSLAIPGSWFDPSRLRITTSVSVGSGGFAGGVDGLQVTSLGYRFDAPLWMNVSVGNAFGSGAARTNRSFFLEGFDVGYRPLPGLEIQVHYRDIRSPLQVPSYPYGYGRR